ncbi:TGS domain protein, partial [Vibrio parahaemolyticus V-223/04]
SQQLA